MSNDIILNNIQINENMVTYLFTVKGNIKKYFNENKLFVRYNHDVREVPKSILSIVFVANIIPLIWISNSKLYIDELDYEFYNCLPEILLGFKNMYPKVDFKGNIYVENLIKRSYKYENEAAQLFTGGVDAVTTFIRIKDKFPFLITHNGWFINENTSDWDGWDIDKKIIGKYVDKYGLKMILIESNYGKFINYDNLNSDYYKKLKDNWWHGIHHGLALICTSIPMAYLFKIETIYIASSFYEGFEATCASDPRIDNNIKYASGKVFHDSYEYNRQDKLKMLTEYADKSDEVLALNVCFKNENNCCKCEKCMRTIMGIIAEGKDPSKFGFYIDFNISEQLKKLFNEELKFFSKSKIMIWNIIIERMRKNKKYINNVEEFEWLLKYDIRMAKEIKLFKYRIAKFIPIVKRKIKEGIAK